MENVTKPLQYIKAYSIWNKIVSSTETPVHNGFANYTLYYQTFWSSVLI